MHFFTFVCIQLHSPSLTPGGDAVNVFFDNSSISVYMVRPNSTNDFSIVCKNFTCRIDVDGKSLMLMANH